MTSTPDEPLPPSEGDDGSAGPDEPVIPPAPDSPAPAAGHPPLPPPGGWQQPPTPPPGGWQQPPTPPPGGWQQYPSVQGQPPRRTGLSFGARLGIGIGIGVLAHVLGLVAVFALAPILSEFAEVLGPMTVLWPFVLVAVVGIVLMFLPKTRPYATGILITVAAMWLIVIGPCIALITGLV